MLKALLALVIAAVAAAPALAQQATPEQMAAQRASIISLLAGQLAVAEVENSKLKEQLAKSPASPRGPEQKKLTGDK